MRAGPLRHRVVIQQATEAVSTAGAAVISGWTTFATRWAEFEDADGREFVDAGQPKATYSRRVRMRKTDGITPKMRLSWNSRTFNIVTVAEAGERNRETVLTVTERQL